MSEIRLMGSYLLVEGVTERTMSQELETQDLEEKLFKMDRYQEQFIKSNKNWIKESYESAGNLKK
jgi:hypothetical protein